MKNVIILLFSISTLAMTVANLAEITRSIGEGDADALGAYFDNSVEISVLDREDVYNRSQAISVIRSFFQQNQPRSFSQVHKGTSKGNDSQYCIGNLVTASRNFRVYIYMKIDSNNRAVIQELRFDAA